MSEIPKTLTSGRLYKSRNWMRGDRQRWVETEERITSVNTYLSDMRFDLKPAFGAKPRRRMNIRWVPERPQQQVLWVETLLFKHLQFPNIYTTYTPFEDEWRQSMFPTIQRKPTTSLTM
jgi:hypothetical protein